MSTDNEEKKGICILSFDSGGPGTYAQLLILKEYMSRLANNLGVSEEDAYPADYFDLMGGVGFGGLVSIMLGHLRMNVEEAIDALITVATTVFGEDSQDADDPEANSKHLKEAIEEMLQTREIPVNSKMCERGHPRRKCKVVLYAATSASINHPQAFRTYSARGSSLNPTIVEAVCATMAVPSLFSPVKIGPRLRQQSFIGGALGANNPTRELLKEASAIFGPNRRVAQVLSIGSGLPRVIFTESSADSEGVHRLLTEIATDCEMVAQELSTRLYTIDAYLRLNVDRGMELVTMMDWNELGSIESRTAAYIATAIVTGALDSSVRCLQERTGSLTLEQINQSSSVKIAAKTAPSVSPYFVLRVKEWEKLVWHLITSPFSWQRILTITGMGGCGKTQMVSYFLREYPSLHAVFVDASTLSSIKADLQAWVRVLGDGHERDVWEDAIRILSSAPGDERWVLILDNADDPTLNLVPFMPKNVSLTLIITSRNRNLGNLSTTYHMELGEMEPDEALATLLHAARCQLPLPVEEMKSAHTLLKELGCLAVALVQAGTYCHELSYLFTKYLSLFYSHRAELMKRAEPSPLDNYERGAYTTLDLSYKALPQDCRDFLHFISFFHHADIPLSALATAAKKDFNEDGWQYLPRPDAHKGIITDLRGLLCANGSWSEMQVQDTLRTLRSFSLLSITSLGNSVFLRLHPLIQAWSRDMELPIAQPHRAMTLQVLTTCCGVDSFQLHQYLLPHILDILEQMKGQDIHINDLMAAGNILDEQGHYQPAGQLFETALEIMGKTAEPNETDLSAISLWLASVYKSQGRWSQAEKMEVKVLEQWKRILGMEHPDTILSAANLAMTYSSQGRWNEAEKLGVDVLEQRRRILGMDHPDTMLAAANLASTYHSQGRWREAEKLDLEVLEQQRRIVGMEHPHTISAAANLASTYHSQGRWGEAEKLDLEVLEQRRKVLGLDHPHTIMAAANLAWTYHSQGRWSEAEKLGMHVLEQRRRILGMEHPDTIMTIANLASTYHSQGRWSEAEEQEVDVLEQRRRILGMEHPETIRAAANLASTYRLQGRWSEAEKLEVDVLEQRERILGMEHPDTIVAAGNLASTYRSQGRWSKAEKLEMAVLEQRRRILGMEHPHTISAAANLAATYGKQSRWKEDAALLAQAVQLSLKVLGQRHPHTQMHLRNLVFVYEELGKEREAQKTRDLLLS